MRNLIKITLLIIVMSYSALSHTENIPKNSLYDAYPWSVAYYHGQTFENPLTRILRGDMNRWPEQINTLEFAYTLPTDNLIRQFFYPVVGVVQLASNVTVRHGANQNRPIYELDPYILFRFSSFPWNTYVMTSFAIGEGISYVTAVPSLEQQRNARHLLNFLMFEATFSHPHYPRLQLLTRIHHRSGAFGLYQAGNTGSNDLSIGLRYLFD